MKFQFPSHIKSNFSGYQTFVKLYQETKDLFLSDLILDFSKTIWFEANLSAILGSILSKVSEELNEIYFEGLSLSVESILLKNHFLSNFGQNEINDTYETTIKYKKFNPNDGLRFKTYLDNELLSQPDLPRMSEKLKKKINESIFEIFNNANNHGQCQNVFSCGQYYPKRKKLDFTIVDLGNSIKFNVNNYLGMELTGKEAIEWAVEEGNTTKTGNIPGGLGISLIREFLKMNKGEIQIVSSDGFWEEKKDNNFAFDFESAFVGTIVNLEFNINDYHSYVLSSEIDTKDIF